MAKNQIHQINEWLTRATKTLEAAQIPTARLDALILLEDATGYDRAWLLANGDEVLSVKTASQAEKWLARRSGHEPLAYIRGKSGFYGREFKVTPATLQPRPETETMLELLFELVKSQRSKVKSVVDVGTGSGAIAITTKLEHPELAVSATEINTHALKIAKQNANTFGTEVVFYKGNLLEPILNPQSPILSPFAILANLPYVPDDHTINRAAMQEPHIAIFGGTDGLDIYRGMFEQISTTKQKPKFILTESLPFQHTDLTSIAAAHGYTLQKTDDFIQLFAI